jgi:prepilin-type N-terminal cleavage/methylation domain-containing protein
MNQAQSGAPQMGFTLIELLTALAVFLLICGTAFTLLATSQQRYQTEAQVLTSFQEARLGLDQIIRDANDAGFPPPIFSDGIPSHANQFALAPFAWSPGYTASPPAPCQIGTAGGGTCTTPGDIDLIIETNPSPPTTNVQWIRYQLQGTTLMRGMVEKAPGNDPDAYTAANGNLAPFVQNVVNNQAATYAAAYPGTFPGGNPVPIFSYTCDSGNVPLLCTDPGANNAPANIRDVIVTLIVAAPSVDATTGVPRLVQLTGRGRRINPNQ